MATRLQWSRIGLSIKCETEKRAMPKTALAFALPPFAEVNTSGPGISVALVTDPITTLVTALHIESLEPLAKGYTYTLNYATGSVWTPIVLGQITELAYNLPVTVAGVTYRLKLTRAWRDVVEVFQEVTVSIPADDPPANVTGLTNAYNGKLSYLAWTALADPRGISYEIRKGSSWDSAQFLSTVPASTTTFATQGDGTYWVASVFRGVYCASPTSITLVGTAIVANVVQTWDERATSWAGTFSGGAALDGLGGIYLAGGSLDGYYEVPASHVVDLGTSQFCQISSSLGVVLDPGVPFDSDDLFDSNTLFDGSAAGLAAVIEEIAIAQADGVFGAWQPFVQGNFLGRRFKLRLHLTSLQTTVTPRVQPYAWTVDMPDRWESKTVSVPAAGLAITYATPFHNIPKPQITILNMQAGDVIVLSSISSSGFTLQVTNGGVGVARSAVYLSPGY